MNCYRTSMPLVLLFVLAATATAKNQVCWIEDLATAQQMAASRNQLLLLHFTADWCGPCQRLEKNVFSEPSFGFALNSEFVPCKINVTKHPELAARFGVTAWPTDLLLTADGKEIHRMVSPQVAEPYLNALRQANWQYRNSINSSQLAASQMPQAQPRPPSSQISGDLAQQLAERFGGARTAEIQQAQFMQLQAPGTSNPPSGIQAPTGVLPQPPQSPPTAQTLQSPPYSARQLATVREEYSSPPQPQQPQSNPVAAVPQASHQTAGHVAVNANRGTEPFAAAAHTDAVVATPGSTPAGYQAASGGEQMVLNRFAASSSASPPAESRPGTPAAPSRTNHAMVSNRSEIRPATMVSATDDGAQREIATDSVIDKPTPASDSIRLGLDGYCPVTLLQENQWLAGNKRWGAKHRGVVYLFASAAAQQIFLSDPDRFSPVLAGYDPVVFCDQGTYVTGARAHGIRYRDAIILFSSEESLEEFSAAPEPFMTRIAQALSSTVAGR